MISRTSSPERSHTSFSQAELTALVFDVQQCPMFSSGSTHNNSYKLLHWLIIPDGDLHVPIICWHYSFLMLCLPLSADQERVVLRRCEQHSELGRRAQHLCPGRARQHLHHHEASCAGHGTPSHKDKPLLRLQETHSSQSAHSAHNEVTNRSFLVS